MSDNDVFLEVENLYYEAKELAESGSIQEAHKIYENILQYPYPSIWNIKANRRLAIFYIDLLDYQKANKYLMTILENAYPINCRIELEKSLNLIMDALEQGAFDPRADALFDSIRSKIQSINVLTKQASLLLKGDCLSKLEAILFELEQKIGEEVNLREDPKKGAQLL